MIKTVCASNNWEAKANRSYSVNSNIGKGWDYSSHGAPNEVGALRLAQIRSPSRFLFMTEENPNKPPMPQVPLNDGLFGGSVWRNSCFVPTDQLASYHQTGTQIDGPRGRACVAFADCNVSLHHYTETLSLSLGE